MLVSASGEGRWGVAGAGVLLPVTLGGWLEGHPLPNRLYTAYTADMIVSLECGAKLKLLVGQSLRSQLVFVTRVLALYNSSDQCTGKLTYLSLKFCVIIKYIYKKKRNTVL